LKSYPEKYEKLLEAIQKIPAIGKKSAMKIAYHLVFEDSFLGLNLAHRIEDAVSGLRKCIECGNVTDHELCHICVDDDRDHSKLCIIASVKDLFVIEESRSFDGGYFIFDAIESDRLEELKNIIQKRAVKEVIFAFTPSVQTDGFIVYLEDRLLEFDLIFTRIAQGVPTGISLENVDMLSLSKALSDRVKA
jgi:recombination protein RecR